MLTFQNIRIREHIKCYIPHILLAAPAPRLYGELLVRFAFGLGTRFVSREHLSDNFLAFFVGDDHPQKSHYEICYDRHYGIDVLIYDAAV